MKMCIRIITTLLVLVAASNAFAGNLTGTWKLQINVTSPVTCAYEDPSLFIIQNGTSISGTAHLSLLGISCPLTLTGTIAGDVFVDPTLGAPFQFFWTFPIYGTFNIAGAFSNPTHASGTFSGGGAALIAGTWSLAKVASTAVPASTPWGRIALIVLAGLGGVYYLKRRRTALS
jgi:hypothetical protein